LRANNSEPGKWAKRRQQVHTQSDFKEGKTIWLKRLAGAKKESAAFQREFKAAGAPPLLKAEPNSFRLGAKVVEETTGLGLPGLHIRILDERYQGKVLAEGITDLDGNAVLFLNKEQATEMAHSRTEPTVEVLTPDGKSLHRAPQALCPRPNHAETWVSSLAASRELEPHISLANETKAEREAHLANLQTKMDRLKAYYNGIQEERKCQLDHTHDILEDLRKEKRAGEKAPGPFSSTERSHTETPSHPSPMKGEGSAARGTGQTRSRPRVQKGKAKGRRKATES